MVIEEKITIRPLSLLFIPMLLLSICISDIFIISNIHLYYQRYLYIQSGLGIWEKVVLNGRRLCLMWHSANFKVLILLQMVSKELTRKLPIWHMKWKTHRACDINCQPKRLGDNQIVESGQVLHVQGQEPTGVLQCWCIRHWHIIHSQEKETF